MENVQEQKNYSVGKQIKTTYKIKTLTLNREFGNQIYYNIGGNFLEEPRKK